MANEVTGSLPDLTSAQRAVADAPPEQKTLVTAGPGTGKTHTLIARLGALVRKHGLSPGHEVLVLSFSRAAVHEIRRRTRADAGDARYVQSLTFDSFATRYLAEVDPGGNWVDMTYDGRISSAIAAICESGKATGELQDVQHVIVDEAQDLVGLREELVRVLLERISGGFTVFGDPAQGIYNFQLSDPVRRVEGSAAFYRWLRTKFAERIVEVTFDENHRAATSSARQALWAGPEIHNATLSAYGELWDRLQGLLLELRSLGNIRETAPLLLKQLPERTAVLCRTNGQALMCSRRLWDDGVCHALARGALDRVVPPWLAILFAGYQYTTITRSRFLDRVHEVLGSSHDAGEFWTLLKHMDSTSDTTLRLDRVAERIRIGAVPHDLYARPASHLVVSTIHRAKGLEFDTVVYAVGPQADRPAELGELAEEVRVLYVALTRARRTLLRIEVPRFRGLFHHERADRWVRRFDWRAVDFEVVAEDVDRLDPAGSSIITGVDPAEVQAYIARQVATGDSITLRLLAGGVEGEPRAVYEVRHAGSFVGVTTDEFSKRLFSFLNLNRNWTVRWPTEIRNLRVDSVDTVAGVAATARKFNIGVTGLWLRVRIAGLGSLHF